MTRRSSRSTATPSRTAPSTRSHARSAATTVVPANLLIGLTSMVVRLWLAEQPARRRRRLGHARRTRPTATSCSRATRRGREFDPEIVEQLDLAARRSLAAAGIVCVQGATATRPTTSSRPRSPSERARGGTHARRDLRPRRLPARGAGRHDPAARSAASASSRASARPRCGSATASSPSRCPTSSRCAAIRPTRSRARAAWERRRRRRCSPTYRRSRRCSRPGASRRRRTQLRVVPSHRDARPVARRCRPRPTSSPTGRRRAGTPTSSASRGSQPAPRGGRVELDLATRRSAHLHPTGHHHHPERQERLTVLLDGASARAGRRAREPASRSSASTTPAYVERIAALRSECWLDGDTLGRPDHLGGGAARRRVRDRGGRARRVRARASAGPPRAPRPGDGLLHLRQRRRRGPARTGRARRRAGRDRRLGRAPRQRHRGDRSAATTRSSFVSLHQWPFYPGTGGPGTERRDDPQRPAPGRLRRRRRTSSVFDDGRRACGARPSSPDAADRLRRVRRARRRSARRAWRVTADGLPRAWPRAARSLAPRVAAVLEGGYNARDAARARRGRARGLRAGRPPLSRRADPGTSKRPGCGPAVSVLVPPR